MAYGVVEQSVLRMRIHEEDYAAAIRRLTERGPGGASWCDNGLLGPLVGVYAECSRTGIETLTGLSMAIGETGGGLEAVVGRARDTEAATGRDLQRLHGEMGV